MPCIAASFFISPHIADRPRRTLRRLHRSSVWCSPGSLLVEAENSEIVEIVRGMSVSLTDLPVLLQTIKSGGTLGQNVPKSDSTDKEDSE